MGSDEYNRLALMKFSFIADGTGGVDQSFVDPKNVFRRVVWPDEWQQCPHYNLDHKDKLRFAKTEFLHLCSDGEIHSLTTEKQLPRSSNRQSSKKFQCEVCGKQLEASAKELHQRNCSSKFPNAIDLSSDDRARR